MLNSYLTQYNVFAPTKRGIVLRVLHGERDFEMELVEMRRRSIVLE